MLLVQSTFSATYIYLVTLVQHTHMPDIDSYFCLPVSLVQQGLN